MNLKKLEEILADEPRFRKKQTDKLIYQDLIDDWQSANVLPMALRERLNCECPLPISAKEFKSDNNSRKALITFADNNKIETVLIKNSDKRWTVCVSCQVGCPMGCKFCATGKRGFVRNLSSMEIIEQILYFARLLKSKGHKIDNVVYMGMGEPALNINNVLDSIAILNDQDKFGLGSRRISISTIGLRTGFAKIIDSGLQINLAISLHAVNDALRHKLMPGTKAMSIKSLLKLVDNYISKTNRQVMFEYILLKGVNDDKASAEALAKLMNKSLYMVNLIKYNETGSFKPTDNAGMTAFQNILKSHGVRTTIRHSKGQEMRSACGQLAGV